MSNIMLTRTLKVSRERLHLLCYKINRLAAVTYSSSNMYAYRLEIVAS